MNKTTSIKKPGRAGIPVDIIDTQAMTMTRYESEATAAVAIFDNYERRMYINQATCGTGTGTVPFSGGRYIARRVK